MKNIEQYGKIAAQKLEARLKTHPIFNHRTIHCQLEDEIGRGYIIKIFVCYKHCMVINLDNWWCVYNDYTEKNEISEESFNRLISVFDKIKHIDEIDSIWCVLRPTIKRI